MVLNFLHRRRLLLVVAAVPGLPGCGVLTTSDDPLTAAGPLVKPDSVWTTNDLLEFMRVLPPDVIVDLKRMLGLVAEELPTRSGNDAPLVESRRRIVDILLRRTSPARAIRGTPLDQLEIVEQLCKIGSWARVCWDVKAFDYHQLVERAAHNLGISIPNSQVPTYEIEKRINDHVVEKLRIRFEQEWDKLSREDRIAVLEHLDPDGRIKDKAALAAFAGTKVFAAIAAVVGATGISGYLWLTSALGAVTAMAHVTLPFSAYMAATKMLSVIAGPVGWGVALVGTGVGTWRLARPNVQKAVGFILQMHALKEKAIKASGWRARLLS